MFKLNIENKIINNIEMKPEEVEEAEDDNSKGKK